MKPDGDVLLVLASAVLKSQGPGNLFRGRPDPLWGEKKTALCPGRMEWGVAPRSGEPLFPN